MLRRLARALDDRLGLARAANAALNRVFPDHWSFMLGEIALYCFVVLVLTGVFLTFFFEPSVRAVTYHGPYEALRGVEMSAAYRSGLQLSFEVRAGLVMRQVHHWSALVFAAAIVVHLMRVFFTGAFRRPRELNWIIGVTLLVLVIANGFFGYSLLDDLLSGTGVRVAYSIALSVPLVGPALAFGFFGGEFPDPAIIPRFFMLHVLILPGMIIGLLGVHLAIVWRQKHTQFKGPGRTEQNITGSRLWPAYATKSAGLFIMVTAVLCALGGLAQINPIWVYGPFRTQVVTAAVTSASQPDWYMGWLDGALRLMPAWETRVLGYTFPNPFFPGVLLPGLTFAGLYLWPFLEARWTGDRAEHNLLDRPRDAPLRTALGTSVFAFYAVLFLAGSNDILAALLQMAPETITTALRVAVFAVPTVVFVLTRRVCRELQQRGGAAAEPAVHRVMRCPGGGYAALRPHSPPRPAAGGGDRAPPASG